MLLFETERLIVRRFTGGDMDAFYQLNSNPQVLKYIRPVKNKEECAAFLAENINLYKDGSVLGRYAVAEKETGRVIGTFSYLYLSGESDFHIGYALLPEAWGNGYATELVKSGIPYLFVNAGKKALFAITDPENTPSQQVLLKNGFLKIKLTHEYGKPSELFCFQPISG